MDDFQIDLLDFEINDKKTPNSDNNLENNNKNVNQKKSLDFTIKLKEEKQSLSKEIKNENQIVEKNIFPNDNEMPKLDEDIINTELIEQEGLLPNSIQPLSDADIVFKYDSID